METDKQVEDTSMRKSIYLIMSTAAVAAFIGGIVLLPPLSIAQQKPAEEPRAADADPSAFNPQLGALMNMVIQPRHTKLGLAGKAENWALASYYFKELKLGFLVVSKAVPRWKGLPIPDLFDAAVTPTFAVLDFAIKAGEPRQFAESYEKLTTGCNNCHATLDHQFITIKAPDASNFPDQEFKPGAR
jgi:hypothetical protein